MVSLGDVGRLSVLDVPCGFGRHSVWLARAGHKVMSADIDEKRILTFQPALFAEVAEASDAVVLDATEPLLFKQQSFDLAIIVDYVAVELLGQIADFIRPGGWLIYETFGAGGYNWKDLPVPGITASMLSGSFDTLRIQTKPAGPNRTEAQTVKFFGQRKR